MKQAVRSALFVLIVYVAFSVFSNSRIRSAGAAASDGVHSDWPLWGGDAGSTRFSSLTQITPENVGHLKAAWVYAPGGAVISPEATPVVVGGKMYITVSAGVAALDPETGKEIWRFTPSTKLTGRSGRGVAYWPGEEKLKPRIVYAMADRLYVLDAESGKLILDFGDNGEVNLRAGVSDSYPDARYAVTSPPAIYKNLIILAPGIQELGSHGPSGDPRAFDVVTGKMVWRFHSLPQPGEPGSKTWGPKRLQDRAGPSAWGFKTVDADLGLVFIPTGNPVDSYNGVDRPGNNLYSDSIVALDAATGKLKWYFQATHHDLFDYDLAAPPALIDIHRDGKTIPALVQNTKMGLVFILDRRTGKPVFGVEERPVPKSDVPGEQSSPTQPFPIKPIPLARMGMTRNDITTMTPEAHAYCLELWDKQSMHSQGPYSPPSVKTTNIFLPGANGAQNYGGLSYNPQLGYIFTNISNLPTLTRMVPDGKGGYTEADANMRYNDPNGWPCVEPPWGEFIAINASTGDVVWRSPLGAVDEYGPRGIKAGTPNIGGSVATASGLVFIGASRDSRFHAYDAKTGSEIWTTRLPGQGATPITFEGKNGRQYVALVSGNTGRGRGDPGRQGGHDPVLIAFALPKPGEPIVNMESLLGPSNDTQQGSGPRKPQVAMGDPVSADALPAGPGRDDLLSMCGSCHDITTVTSERRTPESWTALITDMRGRGAPGDDAMASRVQSYLSQHFALASKDDPSPKGTGNLLPR
jgi:glucose dehydrogenase